MSMIIQQFATTTRAAPLVNRLARLGRRLKHWLFPAPVILSSRPCDETRLTERGSFGPVGEVSLDGLAAGWQYHYRQQQLRLRNCDCPA